MKFSKIRLSMITFFCLAFFISPIEVCLSVEKTIKDANGKTFIIEKPFNRIISLYGAHTENLFYLGLDKEIIGVTKNESFPEAAKNKEIFTLQDDPEKYIVSGAELVLVRPMIERGYPNLINHLMKANIEVISLQPKNVDEMYDYWLTLGILTGKEQEAIKMVNNFKEKVEYYKLSFQEHIIKQNISPPNVYFEAIHSKMKTFTPDSMALFALDVAGGINIATDAEASRGTNIGNYGKEKILSHSHEIDVYLAQYGVMNQTSVEIIKNEPGFAIIKAIKNNQIYIIDEMIVSRPCFRLLQGIEQIRKILYKEMNNNEPIR